MVAKINVAKCNGCGICIYQCGMYVLEFDADRYKARVAKPKDCIDCFFCVGVCPENAIGLVIADVERFLRRQEKVPAS